MSQMMPKPSVPTSAARLPKQAPSKLWYKNYMVWVFVIGLPVFVVVACVWFVFYSLQIQDTTVRDDWYMDGKTLYADVSKDKLAHDLGLNGKMTLNHEQVNFVLNVPASAQFTPTNELIVEISHATQKAKDRDFVVKKLADGSYGGQVNLDAGKGKYYVIVHDMPNTWRLRTTAELPSAKSLTFKPLTAFDAPVK